MRTKEITVENMVKIPAGKFLMGSDNGGEFEGPVHEVYLDEYLIDATPVTNEAFAAFVEKTGYKTTAEKTGGAWGYQGGNFQFVIGLSWKNYSTSDRKDHPVVQVSWEDANAFASFYGKRLPTEAEWEKAARGGLEQQLYPWGNDIPNGTQCNFSGSANEVPPTTPVKQFTPNAYGVYDSVGNVWQWCGDWFTGDYYSTSDAVNPPGPASGEFRVRRGGSWNVIQPFRLRCSNRGAIDPVSCVPNIGFRCAL